jgi:hypothetical protein
MTALNSVLTRRRLLRSMLAGAAVIPAAAWLFGRSGPAAALPPVVVWKDPNCGCCDGWVQHMRKAGFSVTVRTSDDMEAIKQARGVPAEMQSCHTAVIDGYVIEGHVPAGDVMRLIKDRPTAKGLAVPGMPESAPGMDQLGQPYTVMLFGTPSGDQPYMHHRPMEDADDVR